ncbi:MAG TPA: hypothetical protein VF553_19425 [Pyrinomonadaceae bacterium]|jgi:hypothetical protein
MFHPGNRRKHSPSACKGSLSSRHLLFIIPIMMACAGALIFFVGPRNAVRAAGASRGLFVSQAQKAETPADAAFRISQASSAGVDRDAAFPDVAYNPEDNEYLVVWEGDGLSGAEFRRVKEIFGQRLNAATGAEIGPDFLISRMSDSGHTHVANQPQIVYNSAAHEYLVVWHGAGATGDPDEVFEIYGQRLSRSGVEIGKDFRISHTTDAGKIQENIVRQSSNADVAWDSASNQYLVVWEGMGQPEDAVKVEIYGQLLSAKGDALGKGFRISNTTDQGQGFNASGPEVAFNSANSRYLVVWAGGFKEMNQSEIWAQGLTAQGAQVGAGNGDFRISQITTSIGSNRDAGAAHVVYNNTVNEYMVVFQATGLAGAGVEGLREIFGQRINAATLQETGPEDFRISNTAGPKNEADNPRVSYNSADKEYLVIWRGVRDVGPYEIFAQRLSPLGAEIDADFQVSNIAAIGKDRKVNLASVACNSASGEYLTVWQGDQLPGPTSRRINEIFGLRIKSSARRRP